MKILILLIQFLIISKNCNSQIYFNKAIPSSENYVEAIFCQAFYTLNYEIVTFANARYRNKYGRVNRISRLSKEGNLIEFIPYLDSLNTTTILDLKKAKEGYILTAGRGRGRP